MSALLIGTILPILAPIVASAVSGLAAQGIAYLRNQTKSENAKRAILVLDNLIPDLVHAAFVDFPQALAANGGKFDAKLINQIKEAALLKFKKNTGTKEIESFAARLGIDENRLFDLLSDKIQAVLVRLGAPVAQPAQANLPAPTLSGEELEALAEATAKKVAEAKAAVEGSKAKEVVAPAPVKPAPAPAPKL